MLKKYVLACFGLMIVAVMSYQFFSSGFPGQPKPMPENPSTAKGMEVAQQDMKVKLTPQTEIIQKIKYTKCGDEEIIREKAGEKLLGLTFSQLQQVFQGWTIESFDAKEVLLVLQVDGYCKTHTDNLFLGIHNGHVAIYGGTPGAKAVLKEETNITIQSIHPQDQEELAKGIIIKDRSELLQTLEGLQEHR